MPGRPLRKHATVSGKLTRSLGPRRQRRRQGPLPAARAFVSVMAVGNVSFGFYTILRLCHSVSISVNVTLLLSILMTVAWFLDFFVEFDCMCDYFS